MANQKGMINAKEALTSPKVIALYFSMHSCPPCRQFTPILASLYEDMDQSFKGQFEVVFVSCDSSKQAFDKYYAEMPWLALPWGDPRIDSLCNRFGVNTVPRLVILRADGTILEKNAV